MIKKSKTKVDIFAILRSDPDPYQNETDPEHSSRPYLLVKGTSKDLSVVHVGMQHIIIGLQTDSKVVLRQLTNEKHFQTELSS